MAKLGKDQAKHILIPLGVPMAKTYGILRDRNDVGAFRTWIESHNRFVLKPASGHGGEGILLVRSEDQDGYDTSLGPLTARQIEAHALAILSGDYGGDPPDVGGPAGHLPAPEGLAGISPLGLPGAP